jgi:exodeoxyribonuclease VII small subunit
MISSEKFEQSIQKLELLVKNLEAGNLPLDEALTSFQEGITLVKQCQGLLSQAEQRVDQLVKASGETLETKPFNPES